MKDFVFPVSVWEYSKHLREARVPGLYALTENKPHRKHRLLVEMVVQLQANLRPEKKIADKDKCFSFQLKNSKQEAQIHVSDCSQTAGKAAAAETSQRKEL